ncbi:bacteriocin fulvocin C-related protein [Nonomuraea sp. NPDC050202]|jgi:hypothetical protein|uniref:bacteriocin fulvocin C-related protein n=1 Tax=Nonomuraea sp. NPDC050202 TaxID=3155035 RepID=UPI003400529F
MANHGAWAGDVPEPSEDDAQCYAWVQANKHNLPHTYADFSRFSIAYRRAIYQELPPAVRSRLWTEQITQYLSAHPGLSTQQRQVLADAQVIVGDEAVHRPDSMEAAVIRDKVMDLHQRAVEAFGHDQAHDLLSTLGPSEPSGSCRLRRS